MKFPVLSAILLAGSASGVAAAPADRETTERTSYNESRRQPEDPPASRDGWIELASSTPARHGRKFITVDGGSRFTRLRLEASEGRLIVRSVLVNYKDGTSRRVNVDKVLDHKRATFAMIDLHGAQEIDQVVVNTQRDSRGAYTVHGERERFGVASR